MASLALPTDRHVNQIGTSLNRVTEQITSLMKIPAALSRIIPGDFTVTPPVIALLCANSITIVLAVAGNWDAATVLFIYWAQSVIIGIFTVIALMRADTAAISSDRGMSLEAKAGLGIFITWIARYSKYLIAGFFALHYGLFHWGYFEFIVDSGLFGVVDFSNPGVWTSCGLFFVNHLFSSLYYRRDERKGGDYVQEEFIQPYSRIFPMHLTIIFGAIVVSVLSVVGIESTLPVLVLFLVLKIYADMRMHIKKHAGEKEPVLVPET